MEIGLEHFESCAIRKVPQGTKKGRALMSALPTESSEVFRSPTRRGHLHAMRSSKQKSLKSIKLTMHVIHGDVPRQAQHRLGFQLNKLINW